MPVRSIKSANFALPALLLTGLLLVTATFGGGSKHKKQSAKKAPNGRAAVIAAGKKVYAASRCMNCHKIGQAGGSIGPDLSREGAKASRTVKWIIDQIKDPKSHKPTSLMPAFGGKIKQHDLVALATYLTSLKN